MPVRTSFQDSPVGTVYKELSALVPRDLAPMRDGFPLRVKFLGSPVRSGSADCPFSIPWNDMLAFRRHLCLRCGFPDTQEYRGQMNGCKDEGRGSRKAWHVHGGELAIGSSAFQFRTPRPLGSPSLGGSDRRSCPPVALELLGVDATTAEGWHRTESRFSPATKGESAALPTPFGPRSLNPDKLPPNPKFQMGSSLSR